MSQLARERAIPTVLSGLPSSSGTGAAWHKIRGDRQLMTGIILAAIITITALLVPVLPIQDPLATDYDRSYESPSSDHLLGTDLHGRDVLSRVLWASRPSLLVGVVATAMALATGVVVGGISGLGGSSTDSILMRTADVFLSFPAILGAIAIMAILGPGLHNIFFAIAIFGWPVFARLFRSSVISVREAGYVKAARVMGASRVRIFLRHILPNASGPLVSYTALVAGGAILAEAGLSFINLGVQRPDPSWGLMLAESRGYFESYPWLVLAPGVMVTIATLAFVLVGSAMTWSDDQRVRG